MTKYASQTGVSTEKSKAEIERTLRRYGAEQFIFGWDQKQAVIGFSVNRRQVKFLLPMPSQDDEQFTRTPTGRARQNGAAYAAWEQACRQRWRALALVIKAKLEAVESGITTFDEEFLAHTVLPNGSTVGVWIAPQLERAYDAGHMPALLPSLPSGVVDAEIVDE